MSLRTRGSETRGLDRSCPSGESRVAGRRLLTTDLPSSRLADDRSPPNGPDASLGPRPVFQLRDSCPRDFVPEGTDAQRRSDWDQCSSDSHRRDRAAGLVPAVGDWTPGLDGVRLERLRQARGQASGGRGENLQWADESAERGDLFDAIAWLATLEAIGDKLPEVYEIRRDSWSAQLARTGATDETAFSTS